MSSSAIARDVCTSSAGIGRNHTTMGALFVERWQTQPRANLGFPDTMSGVQCSFVATGQLEHQCAQRTPQQLCWHGACCAQHI